MQIVIIAAYLLFVCVFGVYIMRKLVKDSDDFMVAGRSLSKAVLAGTLLATFVGSGTIVGGASFVFQYGPFAGIFFFLGTPIGVLILYFWLADKVRVAARYTVPEILEIRYGKAARAVSALIILFAFIGITSYQFIGGGKVLHITTGIPEWQATLIAAAIIIFLATIGGLVSVAYTDFISAIFILVSLIAAVPLILSQTGGLDGMIAALPEAKQTITGGLTVPQMLGYFLPLFLLLLGDQNVYQRFSAAENPRTARVAAIGFFVGSVLTIGIILVLAASAAVLLPEIDPATAVLSLANQKLPVLLGGMLLAAAVAIIITTGNSYLLSASANVMYDLHGSLMGRTVAPERRLMFDRLAVVGLGVLAYALGTFFPTILALQMYSYTMYGAAITPALLAALVWRKATPAGGLSAILTGGVATLVWELALGKPLGWNSVLFALPCSVAVLVIVSLATATRENEERATRAIAGAK
ncbi:sodium:solute symporter family protein (plasmid) [Skermanella mucosa]|uniref:sodium:solute symporter family protein n=1 Tax=Skermanella mucosa TaxID=1789672 RepID=UPI00192B95C2|nr:sodium:solute symporter family protein [Skermanella mucosa]UEM24621.1 sodium:solute symporter family protein [Skermanella mucosa]